eukprot:2477531-Alexandrium_andersonii.AAC.1
MRLGGAGLPFPMGRVGQRGVAAVLPVHELHCLATPRNPPMSHWGLLPSLPGSFWPSRSDCRQG